MDVVMLHAELAAVCPIQGVAPGDPANKATWRIDFDPSATLAQQAAAAVVLAAFDPATVNPATIYLQKVAAGVTITSTLAPSLSGLYGTTPQDQFNLIGLQTAIAAGVTIPGSYIDSTLTRRTVTPAQVTQIATAVFSYVSELEQTEFTTIKGQTALWPAPTAVIP